MTQSTDILIIGAGLTGLTTAYCLEQSGFFDYLILEQEPMAGGLCRSVHQDGFTFDYTGHLLHLSDARVHAFIEQVLGFAHFYRHERRAFIYSHGRFGAYPFQSNLYGLPTEVAVQCIEGFVARRRQRGQTFRSWVLQHFGEGLAEHFFFPYQEKIFCYPVNKLSASWTNRFVPATTLTQLIEGTITQRAREDVGYNAQFYYPRVGGIQALVNAIGASLLSRVLLNQQVERVDLAHKIVQTTAHTLVRYNTLINTMPLQMLCQRAWSGSSRPFNRAARALRASSVLNINIGVRRGSLHDCHWVYVPEKKYSFYRVGFPSVLSERMAPAGCSSLALECAYVGEPADDLIERAVHECKQLFSITDNELATVNVLNVPCAYVTYNRWRDQQVAHVLAVFKDVGVYSIGRYGAWQYASMQEAILDGINMAQALMRARGVRDEFVAPRVQSMA